MALRIETFDNVRGGNTLYKALTHPHAARAGAGAGGGAGRWRPGRDRRSARRGGGFRRDLRARPGRDRRASSCRTSRASAPRCWAAAPLPLTALAGLPGAHGLRRRVRRRPADRASCSPICRPGARTLSLDAMRLPEEWLTNRRALSRPAQFRDQFRLLSRHRRAAYAARHRELLVGLRLAGDQPAG